MFRSPDGDIDYFNTGFTQKTKKQAISFWNYNR